MNFLNQYTTDDESKAIALAATQQIIPEFKTEKDSAEIGQIFSKDILVRLAALTQKKKPIETMCGFECIFMICHFEDNIEARYNNNSAEIVSNVNEISSPSLAEELTEEQKDALKTMRKEAKKFIIKGIESAKPLLAEELISAQKTVISNLVSQGLSRSEALPRGMEAFMQENEIIKQKIASMIDEQIHAFCKDRSEDVIKLIDFDSLKELIIYGMSMEFGNLALNNVSSLLESMSAKAEMKEDEQIKVHEDLRSLLHTALTNNLGILLPEQLADMDLSNLKLVDAMNDFRLLIHSLPKSVQSIFAEEKYSAEKVKTLDLKEWKPSNETLSILHDPSLLPQTIQYARLYEQHTQELEKEAKIIENTQRQDQLLLLRDRAADPAQVTALVNAIKKSAAPLFGLLLKKASLTTLNTVHQEVTKPGFVAKDQTKYNGLLTQLKSRINEFRSVTPSALVTLGLHARNNVRPSSEISDLSPTYKMKSFSQKQ